MASFGIDAIRYFANARAAGFDVHDLSYTFNRSNGLSSKLRNSGHQCKFYWGNTDCWETDLRDADQGGDDTTYTDSVDLMWIETHGNHTDNGQAYMVFDTPQTAWDTYSGQWQLGELYGNAEWVMAYSCNTVDRNNILGLLNIFAGLHIYCGAWDSMYDGTTTDECGEDVADNLVHGHTVSQAWHDGVSDWYVDNHPITVCVGDAATWNNGDVRWDLSYLNADHLWGHGQVLADLPMYRRACMLCRWTEG